MPLRWTPWILVSTFVVAGVLDAVFWSPEDPLGPTFIPHGFVVGAMCFLWCKAHARNAGMKPPSGSALLCGLVAPVGIPLYLLRSQGWRKGWPRALKAILVGVAALVLYQVSFSGAAWLVYYR
jgi:hypothetical protein